MAWRARRAWRAGPGRQSQGIGTGTGTSMRWTRCWLFRGRRALTARACRSSSTWQRFRASSTCGCRTRPSPSGFHARRSNKFVASSASLVGRGGFGRAQVCRPITLHILKITSKTEDHAGLRIPAQKTRRMTMPCYQTLLLLATWARAHLPLEITTTGGELSNDLSPKHQEAMLPETPAPAVMLRLP